MRPRSGNLTLNLLRKRGSHLERICRGILSVPPLPPSLSLSLSLSLSHGLFSLSSCISPFTPASHASSTGQRHIAMREHGGCSYGEISETESVSRCRFGSRRFRWIRLSRIMRNARGIKRPGERSFCARIRRVQPDIPGGRKKLEEYLVVICQLEAKPELRLGPAIENS